MIIIQLRFAATLLITIFASAVFASRLDDAPVSSYAPSSFGQIAQSAPPALLEDANYQVQSYPVFPLQLAEGPGRGETLISCSTCHTPRYITMQPPLPAATWDNEVHKMIKVYGAQISEADTQKIIQYLQAHYTPETRN
jgi:hypothetical protein